MTDRLLLRLGRGALVTFAAPMTFDGRPHLPVRLVSWSGDRTVITNAFADRRPAGGMRGPYVVDELTFDEVAVNRRWR